MLNRNVSMLEPKKRIQAGHHEPGRKTPFEWRFAGRPIVAQVCMLPGNLYFDGLNE